MEKMGLGPGWLLGGWRMWTPGVPQDQAPLGTAPTELGGARGVGPGRTQTSRPAHLAPSHLHPVCLAVPRRLGLQCCPGPVRMSSGWAPIKDRTRL